MTGTELRLARQTSSALARRTSACHAKMIRSADPSRRAVSLALSTKKLQEILRVPVNAKLPSTHANQLLRPALVLQVKC